ncbi:MAG: hypothetical protein ACK4WB_03545 [Desulfatiglandales bacterium]
MWYNFSTLFHFAKSILLALVSVFFALYGVSLLISSYGIKDPFGFIMTFFSSNLIILISLVPLAGLLFRLYKWNQKRQLGERDGKYKEPIHRE